MEETNPKPQQQMSLALPLIIGVFIIAAVAVFAFMRNADTPEAETTTGNSTNSAMPAGQEENIDESVVEGAMDDPSEPLDNIQTIDIEAGSFYYSPNVIRVKEGDIVRVNITGVDMMHNFTLDEFNVESDTVKPGETTTVEFFADKVGEFEFYCGIGEHRANGQVGTLIVE